MIATVLVERSLLLPQLKEIVTGADEQRAFLTNGLLKVGGRQRFACAVLLEKRQSGCVTPIQNILVWHRQRPSDLI